MSRFNTPEEVKVWARTAAAGNIKRHQEHDHDLNPYCTPGARADWQRGFDNAPPRSYDHPDRNLWDTHYQRGRATAELLESMNTNKEQTA
jgi:hypothetical protein